MDRPTEVSEFGVRMPPNARIRSLTFDSDGRRLLISLHDESKERTVPPETVRALYGARIRHEALTRTPPKSSGPALSSLALTAATGLPMGLTGVIGGKATVIHTEQLHYALAMRLNGIGELWYLLAASFNFRRALGADATYVTEFNLRELVRRLAAFCPHAVQDSFFAAIIGGVLLPPPVDSLLEFFRVVSKGM